MRTLKISFAATRSLTGRDLPAYEFRHVIIREVTYNLLTLEQRRPLHRDIARYLESQHVDNLERQYAELAEQWECAEEFERAVAYRQKAAATSLERYANHDVLAHIGRIEQMVARQRFELPTPQQADLARMQADACHELSRWAEAQNWFKVSAGLSGIPVAASKSAMVLGVTHALARQIMHRMGYGLKPRNAATAARDRLAAHIFLRLSEQAYFSGDALMLAYTNLMSLNSAERAGAVREIIEGYGGLAIGLGASDMHRLARFYSARSLALAEREGTMHDVGFAHLFAAVYAFPAGHWEDLERHCLNGREIFQRLGDTFRAHTCSVILAYGDLVRGNYEKAAAGLGAFGEHAEMIESMPVRSWVQAGRALLDMFQGNSPETALRRIATVSGATLQRGERLLCDGIEAAARLESGNSGQALRAATAALENMLAGTPTMGIALNSVAAVAEVHLVLAQRRQGTDDKSGAGMARARAACKGLRRYAAKTRICRPRALLVSGRLAISMGHMSVARKYFVEAVGQAVALRMPLEEALCELGLAGVVPAGEAKEHSRRAREILERLGARPWNAMIPESPVRGEAIADAKA